MLRSPWILGTAGVIAGLVAGCSGNNQPSKAGGAANTIKPPESVTRLSAPGSRSDALTNQLNTYRRQTYTDALAQPGAGSFDVSHNDVAYTAAYRHAVYLNSINSKPYKPNAVLGSIGEPATVLTPASSYEDMRTETVTPDVTAAGATIFPALYTGPGMYPRMAAVVGSPETLSNCSQDNVNEYSIWNGDVQLNGGGNSAFRGFNLDTGYNATGAQFAGYTPVDNIWYTRRGRTWLMRAGLKYFAYASPYDTQSNGSCICPPWPLFYDPAQFLGVFNAVTPSPRLNITGFWPNAGNLDVNPYGLDTDMRTIITGATAAQVPNQYSGPPIHFTLPLQEPFLANTTTFAGGVSVMFRKVSSINATVLSPGVAFSPLIKYSHYYTAIFKGPVGAIFSQIPSNDPANDFTALGNAITYANAKDSLGSGELIIQPTSPLEPNTFYQVGVRLVTVSESFPNDINPNSMFVWNFKTNGNINP